MNYFKNQQVLPLQLREEKNREDFVIGESNKNAVSWIDKYPKWKAYVIGDEPRERFHYNHDRLIKLGFLDHNKVLNYYKKVIFLL